MRPRPGGPRLSPRRDESRLRFHCAEGFATQRLARMLHSLVRVSRRVGCSHSDANDLGTSCHASKTGRTSAVSGHCTQCTRAGDLPTRGRSRPKSRPAPQRAKDRNALLGRPRTAARRAVRSPRKRRATSPDARRAEGNRRWPAPRGSAGPTREPPTRPAEPEGFRDPPGPRAGTLSPTRRRFSCIRFPPNGFAVFLTLFSKYFSPFPHGTCSLSVSCQYLALDGVYHPLWAAFPNNPTLRRQWQPGPAASLTGLSPSPTRLSRSTSTAPTRDNGCLSRPQFSDARRRGFQARAVPTSLAVTEGILVSFFSSAY